MTPSERTVRVLLRLLSSPFRYTKKDLAEYFGYSIKDNINRDLQAIRNAGLKVVQDRPHYRCAIEPDREFKELRHLQALSDADRAQIKHALRTSSARDALYLSKKLDTLYDFQQLGLRALRRPVLDRLGHLEAAKKQKQRVILEQYRSNSNEVKDRQVEPFHVDPELDTLQAYDIDSQDSRHFKLSRIERVRPTDIPWDYEKRHVLKYTDVFRIADNEQIMVHLKLNVQAYNDLIETYPKAQSKTMSGDQPNTYDFQSKVNAGFLGLMNFVMANVDHIEIIRPDSLKKKLLEKIEVIYKKASPFTEE